jgi:hypothetical protein
MNKLTKTNQIFFILFPIFYLFALRIFLGGLSSILSFLLSALFTIVVLFISPWLKVEQITAKLGKGNFIWIIFVVIFLASAAAMAYTDSQISAWIGIAAFCILTLGVHNSSCGKQFSIRWWIVTGLLAGVFAFVTVSFNQILTRFSEEEFFIAVQGGFIFIYWLLMAFVNSRNPEIPKIPNGRWMTIDFRIAIGVMGILFVMFGWRVVNGYQSSFFAKDEEIYPGISSETPFLCGTAIPKNQPGNESTFFNDYIQKISANPDLTAPDKGLLFLATGDANWAGAFRESILDEARQNLFTKPANSVKFDQYLASLRVYAYARVRSRLPDLFSKDEKNLIENWFHAVNRRAMTVEWVDWMYGLAFSAKPEGPYENQESGAGLIALLETEKLADPTLAQQNRDYLARHPRGWEARFRNTDDSIMYQFEWITNAYLQQLYTGIAPSQNVRQSFEWMLLQMLPDGRAPQYNLPIPYSLTGSLYFGAYLLKDPSFLWLAEKSLHAPWNAQFPESFITGTEQSVDFSGLSPTQGSCLLYGDSGLPTQVGPLAPDKVVFRDGWSDDDNYLLLNLRFTGWHRYKGTNTITVIDHGSPIINEQIYGAALSWLPKGRSLFRDKRIPRENLNGLQIHRHGLDAVLYQLLGFGSQWAQDPPFTASVVHFSTGPDMDTSQTLINDWHGWDHSRKIYLVHSGMIVVVDEANGPASESAAVTWNLVNPQKTTEGRFFLGDDSQKAELILLNDENGRFDLLHGEAQDNQNSEQVLYSGPNNGHLRLVSVILTGDWVGAQAKLSKTAGNEKLEIQQSEKSFELNLDMLEK